MLKITSVKENTIDFSMLQGMDTKTALKRLNGNQKMYKKILLQFKERYSEGIVEICEKVQNDSMVSTERKCHEIIGTSANIGANKLFELAKEISTILKTDKHPPETLYKNFENEFGHVITLINEFKQALVPVVATEEFNRTDAVQLLKELLATLDKNIATAIDLADELEPIMASSRENETFLSIVNEINHFEIDTAKILICELIEKYEKKEDN